MSDGPDPATPIRGTPPLTITLFGGNDQIDRALSEELGRRGCRIHAVSVETGWLQSATNVIARIDTPAGERAMENLAGSSRPHAYIVAVCEMPQDEQSSRRLHDLCEQCSLQHHVALIWHAPVAGAQPLGDSGELPIEELATAVVDEVSSQIDTEANEFTSRFVGVG